MVSDEVVQRNGGFGYESRTYLTELFPGRKDEIDELLCIIGEERDVFPPLLLYGGAATGKTSVVRETLTQLRRPYAYVSCRSCHNPRLIFESIINQLLGHVRSKANNYGSAKKCEKITDFVCHLGEACNSACARRYHELGLDTDLNRQVVYIIFDNVELMRGWPGGNTLLSSLLKLGDLTRLPNLGLIFVSTAGPDTLQLNAASREPLPLHFRDYTNEELYQILVRWQPNTDLYSFFLKSTLAPFSRATRKLTELSDGLGSLFEKYCEPIRSGKVKINDEGKRELYTYMRGYIQPALSQTFSIAETESHDVTGQQRNKGYVKMSLPHAGMGFHLSVCSKYLLLAAYIASRNPSTLDDALFGAGDGIKSRKRRRRSSMSAMEKQDADIQEKHLRGPSNCSLERLLAIFQCIAVESSVTCEGFKTSQVFFGREETGDLKDITADVLMQLSTLSSVNLVVRSSSSVLEGLPRFRSNVDPDFIDQVARSINFPLSKYLLHG